MVTSGEQIIPGTVCIDSKQPLEILHEAKLNVETSHPPAYLSDEAYPLTSLIQSRDGIENFEHPLVWPYSVHGRLLMTSKGEHFIGSGTIIGRRIVLTAAQNIYCTKF